MVVVTEGNNVNYGCDGGFLLETLEYATKIDIYDEDSYKYVGYEQNCKEDKIKPRRKIKLASFSQPKPNEAHNIKVLL